MNSFIGSTMFSVAILVTVSISTCSQASTFPSARRTLNPALTLQSDDHGLSSREAQMVVLKRELAKRGFLFAGPTAACSGG
jgi:hypothetical protein